MVTASGPITASSVEAWIGVIGLVLAAVTALAATWRQSRQRSAVASLTATADSYKRQLDAQATEIASLTAAGHRKDAQIERMQGQLSTLTDIVTGKKQLEQLASTLTLFARQSASRTAEVLAQVESVRTEVRAYHEAVTR